MNPRSIFFKLNALFVLALLTTVTAGWLTVMHIIKRDQTDLLLKSRLILRASRQQHHIPQKLIKELGMVVVPPDRARPLLKRLRQQQLHRHARSLRFGGVRIFPTRRYTYLAFHTTPFSGLLRTRQSTLERVMLPLSVFGVLLILLLVIYWLLRRSLLPIRRLQEDILRYGEGEFPTRERFSPGQDEIAQVGNAFYASAASVQRLNRSRQLFVRNIFHELNTPVTKGKILAELVDEPKTKTMLDSIFSRRAALRTELAQMEQITSRDTRRKTRPVRVVDLIDEARDLLYLDEPIPTNATTETIEADFAAMSLAFKNLIDNGRKYGNDLFIFVQKDRVEFRSRGEALPRPLATYIEPFSQGDTGPREGFGLGLYIVHEIAHKHGMALTYRHEDGLNIFSLETRS